jgi:hypothetical protein
MKGFNNNGHATIQNKRKKAIVMMKIVQILMKTNKINLYLFNITIVSS